MHCMILQTLDRLGSRVRLMSQSFLTRERAGAGSGSTQQQRTLEYRATQGDEALNALGRVRRAELEHARRQCAW